MISAPPTRRSRASTHVDALLGAAMSDAGAMDEMRLRHGGERLSPAPVLVELGVEDFPGRLDVAPLCRGTADDLDRPRPVLATRDVVVGEGNVLRRRRHDQRGEGEGGEREAGGKGEHGGGSGVGASGEE